MTEGGRKAEIFVRLLLSHALAYPVAIAWAFGGIPLCVVTVASRVGTTLADADIAHKVLLAVAWPTIGSFVLVHLAGVYWAWSRAPRARLRFIVAVASLAGVAVVGGGGSWLWLMSR